MTRIHIPRGLPASGKSTLARRLAATTGAVHVELDAIKRQVWPDVPTAYDPYSGPGLAVQEAFELEVAVLLAAGRDVVADRTSLNPEGLRRLERLAPSARFVIHDLRGQLLADCIRRDAARPAATRVGPDSIRALHHRWL